ncbi:MAG TPA: outer membrane protein assembly factor BamD [Bacteroidia bacterium]|jgi:outer membrane protein assembly factor BamD|nr:outer membrane protein assembly factor BamD [Bacteroidia bacterium]
MIKKHPYIVLVSLCCMALFSCKPKEHVYDSTTTKKQKDKRFTLTMGKYNRLLKTGTTDEKYAAAIKYFEKENYTKALTLFEEMVTVYKGTAKAEEVNYYFAYCNYNLEDYIIAGYQFRNFVKNFPNSKHTEECAYMNAFCFYLNSPPYSLDQTDTRLAIKEFQRFTTQYPKSERIEKCNELLDILRGKLERKSSENAMLYYNMGDYRASAAAFANHVKDFPSSKDAEYYSYLSLRSYYLMAMNSIEQKKEDRFKITAETYLKFIETYPNSTYLKEAELLYTHTLKNLEKYNTKQS